MQRTIKRQAIIQVPLYLSYHTQDKSLKKKNYKK